MITENGRPAPTLTSRERQYLFLSSQPYLYLSDGTARLTGIEHICADPGPAARPVPVRSLDAIHLGTALHARPALTSFVTYDKRLLDAAAAAGLPTSGPA